MSAWFHKKADAPPVPTVAGGAEGSGSPPVAEGATVALRGRPAHVERTLLIIVLLMQVALFALYFHPSRRQPEFLGTRPDAKASTPTQDALVLPPTPLPQPTPPLAPANDVRQLQEQFGRLQAELDRRMQALDPQGAEPPFPPFPGTPESLDDHIDRMMESAFQEFRALENSIHFDEGWTRLIRSPTLDMQDKDAAYLVVCSLPGLDETEVKVTLEGRLLTILGESSTMSRHPLHRSVHFERRVWLPGPVDSGDNAHASLTNGVLRVVVPKAERMPQVAKLTRLL